MKILMMLAFFVTMPQAQAALKCNVPKTAWHLYQTKSAISDLKKCFTPSCVEKKIDKAETSLCKALNKCEALSVELENPCLETNRLTAEAKKFIVEEGLKTLADEAEKIFEAMKDEVVGSDEEEESPSEEGLEN